MSLMARFFALLLGVLSTLGSMQPAFAEESSASLEHQVKSAYIFKFGNYIKWPDKAFPDLESPLIIGVVENEPIAQGLEKIAAGHSSGNRKVVIKRVNEKNIMEGVHLLYIARDVKKYLPAYRSANAQSPTLLITDTVNGLEAGSVINFVHDNDRLRFDVSMPAMEHNHIKLDASLLSVARQVVK